MKRNWDLIRQVLAEVEALTERESWNAGYGLSEAYPPEVHAKGEQALLLWKAGFIEAADTGTMAGPAIQGPKLTWAGHDLLDTMRSKPVWDRIKSSAKEKGIELTFEAVKKLGSQALDWVLSQASGG